MPAPASSNDSILTFGLELLEETEQAVGVIAAEIGWDGAAPAPPSPEPQQAQPLEIESHDAERAARHEELAKLADLELAQSQELAYER